ncbi:MAG: TauD/TfdA family dioxygenase, partial [Pseudomonadota bacterium]
SRSILDFLFRRALIAEYQLRVSWAPNTMVIWDNRSVQHYAPNDYQPQRRRMERVTVRGTKPIGDTPTMYFAERARGILARNVGETDKEPAVPNAPRRQFDRTEA